jgi:hypothetical protein
MRVVYLQVNTPVTDNVFSTDFPFQKHIYLKNKIQTYCLSENLQISSANINDADRCKKLNLADVDAFRDAVRKHVFAYFVGFFEKWFNGMLSRNLDFKNSKKKSFWSIFGGETGKPRTNPNEVSPPERLHFNVAEFFLMTGNFEMAANEFKAIANAFTVF